MQDVIKECMGLEILKTIKVVIICEYMESMKISRGNYSDAVNQRADNTMDTRKKTKEQTKIYKTPHRILKIEQHEHH